MGVHEAEEWSIGSWFERNFTNDTGISDEAIWFGLVLMTVTIAVWIFIATRFRNPKLIAALALPIVAFVALGNALQHIVWTVLFSEYAPGSFTSVMLVIPAVALVIYRMHACAKWLSAVSALAATVSVYGAWQTFESGSLLLPEQLLLHNWVIDLTARIGIS